MKYIQTEQQIEIPEGVTVSIKSRIVKVVGPRGTLTKNLKHIDVTFTKVNKQLIKVAVHNGDRKHVAALRTVKSLVDNMITGVTKGYKYKMRYVYAHFPINVNIVEKDGAKFIEVRNFLGDKKIRNVPVRDGVTIEFSTNVKDEIVLSGNSVEDVSQNAADLQQICRVRNKDIRKFLDGIYVSHKGFIVEDM
ncbi:AEG_G0046580.mRNA.1.CDS.1 [Saccharomyces cerevisiae]|nr:Rpl9bp [Saccharomyces cerevisiae YJM693]AJT18947.1 Rpl9bp [Saccharomyces cerevisiae YJM1304]AJT19685.1 Rpl9bp [Saccharomyces cerevisiae YJM1311]AJT26330.1 Rpl9bp [Saccharomyces cerevisiae YJM1401]CAI4746958.1 AEG_G0046580.mRNA.1.CDS.1 [Saccharomyces cerevisiae]